MTEPGNVLSHPTVTERYFTDCYSLDVQGKACEDHCILFHHNKICVVTIAPSHPLIAEKKEIVKVDFQITENTNRMNNKVSGKGKRGGQWLTGTSPLCKVQCSDGSEYTLFSCINGKLVEVNENLLTNPQLLLNKPQSDGYIAIVLPKFGKSDEQQKTLSNRQLYLETINKRQISL